MRRLYFVVLCACALGGVCRAEVNGGGVDLLLENAKFRRVDENAGYLIFTAYNITYDVISLGGGWMTLQNFDKPAFVLMFDGINVEASDGKFETIECTVGHGNLPRTYGVFSIFPTEVKVESSGLVVASPSVQGPILHVAIYLNDKIIKRIVDSFGESSAIELRLSVNKFAWDCDGGRYVSGGYFVGLGHISKGLLEGSSEEVSREVKGEEFQSEPTGQP